MKTTHAWHFTGTTLRDGRAIPPIGQVLKHTGKVTPCISGLHFSLTPSDALQFAPGPFLHLVRIDGEYLSHNNKGVADNRTIVASMDATELLRFFARMQALSVVHLWDAPDLVLDYLMTGDESIRDAARNAAWNAAWNAARNAAWDADWNAARNAAWNAARNAARDAAWNAARNAAWDAAWDAARDAARDAAEAAARKEFNDLVYECFEGPLAGIKARTATL